MRFFFCEDHTGGRKAEARRDLFFTYSLRDVERRPVLCSFKRTYTNYRKTLGQLYQKTMKMETEPERLHLLSFQPLVGGGRPTRF